MSRLRVSHSGLLVFFFLIAALVSAPALYGQDTWVGGGANKFSTANNWSPTGAPNDGDALIFPVGGTATPNNDISNLVVDTIAFGDATYTLSNNAFDLVNGISFNNPTHTVTIGNSVTLDAPQAWTVNGPVSWTGGVDLNGQTLTTSGSGTLTISGVLGSATANSKLVTSGPGTVVLTGNNTYTGGTTVNGGTLQVGGSNSATGAVGTTVAINSGGTLSGSNSGGRLNGTVTVASGGAVSPGTTGAGVLKVTALTFNSGATYQVDLKGAGGVAGTDFDQLNGSGTVTLGGANLSILVGYVPTPGDTFTIVSAGTRSGNFAQSSPITAGGFSFSITYTGTTVVLTCVAPTSTFVWSGAGADLLWSTGNNWVGNTAPSGLASAPFDNLVFGKAGALQLANTQNTINANTWGSIAINTSGFNLGGGTTGTLNTGITTTYSGSSTIAFPVSVAAAQTFNIGSGGTLSLTNANSVSLNADLTVTGGGNLSVTGNILNTGNINKSGTGTLTISGPANNYTGTNTISGGVALINADLTAGGTVTTVVNGGTLSGTGKTGTGTVTATSGIIDPGAVSTVGTLTSAAVTMSNGATLNIDTNGNGVNDNYSVASITLGGANLNINHLALPAANDQWTIVTSSGATSGNLSVNGTLICDSTPFTVGGRTYTVTYPNATGSPCAGANGAGNTVLKFTGTDTTPTALTLNIPSSAEGAVATLTATFTDPDGGDSWTATVDWGDLTTPDTGLTIGTNGIPKPTHTYLNNTGSPYTVTVTITDSHNASVTGTTTATVTNVTPIVTLVAPSADPVDEGTSFTVSGTFTDGTPTNSTDDHGVQINWGDGNIEDVPPSTFSTGTGLGAGVLSYGPISHFYVDLPTPGAATSPATITVKVKDQDGAVSSTVPAAAKATITVNNVAPTLVSAPVTPDFNSCTFDFSNANFLLWTATCPVQVVATFTEPTNVNEGSTYKVDVKFSDSVTSNFDSASATNQSSPATVNKSLTFFIFNGPIQACTTVTDHNTGVSNQICNNFTFNTPPLNTQITSLTPAPNEGQLVTLSGTYDDPNSGVADTHTITVNWGDGTTTDTLSPAAAEGNGLPFSDTHTYKDNGTYTISITTRDSGSLCDPDAYAGQPPCNNKNSLNTTVAKPLTTSITVNNVAPVLSGVTAGSGNENDTIAVSGTITDPGILDTFTLDIDWGDGSAHTNVPLAAATTSFNQSHQYLNNPAPHPSAGGNFNITVTVTDKDGGAGTASPTSTINNVAPVLGAANVTDGLFPGDITGLAGTITDVGTLDTHQVVIDWGDATPNTVINRAAGVTAYNTNHSYALGGVYTVTVNGTDNDGAASAPVTATATVPDFAVTAPVNSATVLAGQTGPYTIRVAQLFAPFTKPVTLSCSGLPAGAACSFAAPNPTPGATFVDDNMSISTTMAGLNAPPIPDQNAPVYAKLFSYGGFGLAGFVIMAGSRRKHRKLFMTGMLLLVLGLVLFLPGCGASGGGNHTDDHANNASGGAPSPTPKGTYTITVTGSFNGPPTTSHATTVTLTVN